MSLKETDVVDDTFESSFNTTENTHFPVEMLGFTAASAFIIAIIGTLGNLLTIFALPMCRKLRTTATAFVINLAVSELLFCVVILPMSGAQYAYLQYYTESLLSNRDCIFFALVRYTLTQAELQTIVAIALTRAIAVGLPNFYRKIDNNLVTGIYIAGIWLYSFLIKLPTGLGVFGSYTFNPKTMECDMARDLSSAKARIIMILVEFIIPVLLILFLYVFIFIMVKKSSNRVASSRVKTPKSSSVSEDPSVGEEKTPRKGSITSYKSLKRMVSDTNLRERFSRRSSSTTCIGTSRRDMRVARTIFIIFMMVLVCSVPVGVIHIIDMDVKQPRRFLAFHILYWLQYCLNVIVYVLMNRQYRGAYIEFVAKLLPSWEQHKNFAFPWENASVSSKPAQGANSSFKIRKDSLSQDPAAAAHQEYKPMDTIPQSRPGRLSAIIEVNSNSYVSSTNDDVFFETKKSPDQNDVNDVKTPSENGDQSPSIKNHQEQGIAEEKEHWIGQNGEALHSPKGEDVL